MRRAGVDSPGKPGALVSGGKRWGRATVLRCWRSSMPALWESISLWKACSEAFHSLLKVSVTPSLWTPPSCKEFQEMGKGKRRQLETNFEQLSKFGTLWVGTGNEGSGLRDGCTASRPGMDLQKRPARVRRPGAREGRASRRNGLQGPGCPSMGSILSVRSRESLNVKHRPALSTSTGEVSMKTACSPVEAQRNSHKSPTTLFHL